MPWSAMKTIPALEGKPREQRELFAEVANEAIAKGRSEEEAIFAGLSAVNTKFKPKSIKKQEQEIPWHLKAVLEASKQALEPIPSVIPSRPTLLMKNALTSNPSRSLVGIEWDKIGRLVLKFDDGERLISEPVPINSISSSAVVINEGSGGGGDIGTPDYIQFNTAAAVDPISQGMITWSQDQETLVLGQNAAQHYLGLDLQVHVRNNTASTITKGTPVMAVGTLGASSRIVVAPMDGTNPSNYKYLLGVAGVNIAAGTDGKILSFGKIRQIDLSAFTDGDVLWISTTQVGKFTNVEPTIGLKMPVAFVLHAANNGTVMVRITPLDENKFLSKSFETVSKNLEASDATYSYTGGVLSLIAYTNGITKALNYTGDVLTSVVLSGSTPYSIKLTKTFTYSGDDLIGTVYS